MSYKEFDHIIKNKLLEQDFVPNDRGWQDIQQQLAQTKTIASQTNTEVDKTSVSATKTNWWNVKRIAAIIFPIALIAGAYAFYQSQQRINVETVSTNNTTENNSNKTIENNIKENSEPKNQQIASTEINSIIHQPVKTRSTANQTTTHSTYINDKQFVNINNKVASFSKKIPIEINNKIKTNNVKDDVAEIEKVVTVQQENAQTTNEKPKDQIIDKNTVDSQSDIAKTYTNPIDILPNNLDKINGKQNRVNKQVHVNFVSDVIANTSTFNGNAINLGISAEKNISNRVYIDAVVHVGRNNPTWLQNQLSNTSPTTDNPSLLTFDGYNVGATKTADGIINSFGVETSTSSFIAGGNNISIAELTTNEEVAKAAAYRLASYQMQVAPMLGFKIHPKLNLLAGLDVVRLFSDKNYKNGASYLLLHSTNNIQLENWDMGANAKVEYNVSNRISIGYKYRQGLTSMTNQITTRRNFNGLSIKCRIK